MSSTDADIHPLRRLRNRLTGELVLGRSRLSQASPLVKIILILALTSAFYTLLPPKDSSASRFSSLSGRGRESGSQAAARVLSSPGAHLALADGRRTKHKTMNRSKTVENWTNPFGFVSVVDVRYKVPAFDPTLLALPQTMGPAYKYLGVARAKERFELVDETETRWRELVG